MTPIDIIVEPTPIDLVVDTEPLSIALPAAVDIEISPPIEIEIEEY